ncbi:hypothetical protein PMAYCL1PPCAC_02848, partial [Pristionchus mayeri]
SGMVPSAGPSTSSGVGLGGPSSLPSTSTSTNNTEARNNVTKVAEVFLTAGHAFQRLGDLTLALQGSANPGETGDNEDNKWTDADIAKLRDSLTRFAHELDTISDSVQQRTMKHIKVDIKRRTLVGDDSVRRGNSPAVSMGMSMPMGGGMGVGGGPMMQKRGAHLMTMPSSSLPPAKRLAPTASYTKFQPYSTSLAGAGRLGAPARPPTSYLTESSVGAAGPPSLGPSSSLLSDPSHHYINTRQSPLYSGRYGGPGNNY